MKILLMCDTLPGNPFHRERLPAIEKAGEGYDLKIIDLFPFKDAHKVRKEKTHKAYFAKANLTELNYLFTVAVDSRNPDILILANLDCVSLFIWPGTIRHIRENICPVVCFFGDDEYMLHRNAHWVERFDICVAYVKWCVDWYNTIVPGSTLWLPNSCFFPEPDFDKLQGEKDIDLLFIGSPFGNRIETLLEIVEYHDINLAIYGPEKWGKIYGLSKYYRGYLEADKIDEAVRRARLVLALMNNHINDAPHMNTKPWEAVRMGTLPIMSYYPHMNDYGFKRNRDYVMGNSQAEIVELVGQLFKDPEKRLKIARNMFEKTKRKFDYVDLYRKLFKKLEAECKSSRQ